MQPVASGESFWKRLLKLFGIGARAEAPVALPAPNKQQGRRDGGRNDRNNRNNNNQRRDGNRGGNDQRRDGNRDNNRGGNNEQRNQQNQQRNQQNQQNQQKRDGQQQNNQQRNQQNNQQQKPREDRPQQQQPRREDRPQQPQPQQIVEGAEGAPQQGERTGDERGDNNGGRSLRGRRNRRGRGRGGDRGERNVNNPQQNGAAAQEIAGDNAEAAVASNVVANEFVNEVAAAPSPGLEFREVSASQVEASFESTQELPAAPVVVIDPAAPEFETAAIDAAPANGMDTEVAAVEVAAESVAVPAPRMEDAQQSLFRPVAPAAEYILPEIKPLSAETAASTQAAAAESNTSETAEERQQS
jgi:ribonuclease E